MANLLTLTAAKADLYGELAGLSAAGFKVYDHEPAPGDLASGLSVTVSTVLVTPTSWNLAVRIYISESAYGAKGAQDTLDASLPTVEATLSGRYGPSAWEFDYGTVEGHYVATCVLEVGREDF